MALTDNKKNVFTTIGSYTSMMQASKVPNQTTRFPSINNKKDVVPYLLDVLKVVSGSFALQQLIGKLFINFVDKAEPQLKSAVKKQTIQYNSGDGLPDDFKAGYSVPVSQIDTYGKLKTNPDSEALF